MKLKITILTNDSSTWIAKQIPNLVNQLGRNHTVKVCYNPGGIEKGDILFLLSVYTLIPKNILKLNKHNIVIHASNLPEGKGWSPASWQILSGQNKIPLTLFEAEEKADSGIIYLKDTVLLNGTELIKDWQKKLGNKIIEMIIKFIKKNDMKGKKQEGSESFYPRRIPEDSRLDVNKTIKEQFNLLRIADNEKYPAFFIYKGKKYILKILQGQ